MTEEPPAAGPCPALHLHRLPRGIRFALIGDDGGPRRAPTVFVLQGSLEAAQEFPVYVEVGRILSRQGFLAVVLEAPAHGEDLRPGEPPELAGWRSRLEKGEDFIAGFNAYAREVLAHLIAAGYADPDRIAACGTSRGGFLAFHLAAAEPRIKMVGGISPVTSLMALREFGGTASGEPAESLSLIRLAPKLAGRPAWISIGNHDERVGTGRAIAFAQALVAAEINGRPDGAVAPVDLIVAPAAGHTHIDGAHEMLANWMLRRFPAGRR